MSRTHSRRTLDLLHAVQVSALVLALASGSAHAKNGGGSGGGSSGGGSSSGGSGGGGSGGSGPSSGSSGGSGSGSSGGSGGSGSGGSGGGSGNSGSGVSGSGGSNGSSGAGGSSNSGSQDQGYANDGKSDESGAGMAPSGGWGQGWSDHPSAHRDQDVARDAVVSGVAVPLSRVIPTVRGSVDGSILDVQLKRLTSGTLVYDVTVLSPSGEYRSVVVDAHRNRVIGSEQR